MARGTSPHPRFAKDGGLRYVAIVALALFAGIAYSILHDQVTARVCVEYFTVGHPRIFPTESPTLLAIGWGIVATWWFALPLHRRIRRVDHSVHLGLARSKAPNRESFAPLAGRRCRRRMRGAWQAAHPFTSASRTLSPQAGRRTLDRDGR